MTLSELIDNIKKNNIPESSFSIYEGLKPNAYILIKNYSNWEFFYLSERGDRNDTQIFYNEESAFDHLWKKLIFELKYPPSIPPKSLGL